MLRVTVLAGALVLGGCSLAFVSGPPSPLPPSPTPVRCTSRSVVPMFDTAVAVLSAVGVVYFLSSDDDNAKLGVAVESGLLLGFGFSAATGWRRISRCWGAKA